MYYLYLGLKILLINGIIYTFGRWIYSLAIKQRSVRKLGQAFAGAVICLFTLNVATSTNLDGPLVAACRCSDFDEANRLLNLGANPNAIGDRETGTPLINAAYNDQPELVQLLLSHGANVNQAHIFFQYGYNWPQTPLMVAAYHPDIISIFKNAGAK